MEYVTVSEQYDPDLAVREVERCTIVLSHYLRHIKLHKDLPTARAFYRQVSKLEDNTRRVWRELRGDYYEEGNSDDGSSLDGE